MAEFFGLGYDENPSNLDLTGLENAINSEIPEVQIDENGQISWAQPPKAPEITPAPSGPGVPPPVVR